MLEPASFELLTSFHLHQKRSRKDDIPCSSEIEVRPCDSEGSLHCDLETLVKVMWVMGSHLPGGFFIKVLSGVEIGYVGVKV
jgi:hypothetical protein